MATDTPFKIAFWEHGIFIAKDEKIRLPLVAEPWAVMSARDDLFTHLQYVYSSGVPVQNDDAKRVVSSPIPPIDAPTQSMWACGVTYRQSQRARNAELAAKGDRTAAAAQPEPAGETPYDIVGDPKNMAEVFPKGLYDGHFFTHLGQAGIRADSNQGRHGCPGAWDVHEAEFGVIMTPRAVPVGFFLGMDMSSRSLEGASPLLLPHAKIFPKCAGISQWLTIPPDPQSFWDSLTLRTHVSRGGETVFGGSVTGKQATTDCRRPLQELCNHVFRLGPGEGFPSCVYFMTGTNVVPESSDDFTLQAGDELCIWSDQLGQFDAKVVVVDWTASKRFTAGGEPQ